MVQKFKLVDQLLFFQKIGHSLQGRQKVGIAYRPVAGVICIFNWYQFANISSFFH